MGKARLINAGETIAIARQKYCAPCKEHGDDWNGVVCDFCKTGGILTLLDDAPEVDPVHAAGAVYCYECRYFHEGGDPEEPYLGECSLVAERIGRFPYVPVDDTFFCRGGKKKREDGL